jgi:hypothetical protein
MVLKVIREHKLYEKMSKCSFYQNIIHYLGHIIYEEGIEVDPKKIEAIKGWTTPKNVIEFISFMGISRYYILIQMDVGGLPPIPTDSFWQFSSLVVFFLVFGSLTCGAILRP